MHSLVLSYFNTLLGPTLLLVAPKNHTFKSLQELPNLIDLQKNNFFIYNFQSVFTANQLFNLPNEKSRGKNDYFLISLILDEMISNFKVLEELLGDFISNFTAFMREKKLKLTDISHNVNEDNILIRTCDPSDKYVIEQMEYFFYHYFELLNPILDHLIHVEKEKQSLMKYPEQNPNPILRIGKDMKILYRNSASQTILQSKLSNSTKIPSTEIQIPQEIYYAVNKAFEIKAPYTFECSIKTKNYFVTAVPILDEQAVNIYMLDISLQVQYRHKLEQLNNTLTQIFKASIDAIRIIDTQCNITDVNDAFIAMVGLSRDQIIGKKCHSIFPSSACHTEKCTFNRILQGNQLVKSHVKRILPDGSEI
jgi:PAS domain S-box-containing protein